MGQHAFNLITNDKKSGSTVNKKKKKEKSTKTNVSALKTAIENSLERDVLYQPMDTDIY